MNNKKLKITLIKLNKIRNKLKNINLGTWKFPSTEGEIKNLIDLLDSEDIFNVETALKLLPDIIGDDELYDYLLEKKDSTHNNIQEIKTYIKRRIEEILSNPDNRKN